MFETYNKSKKILGMNSRNLRFIRPNNLKKAKRIADDKLKSKKLLKKNGIPVPGLIAKIKNRQDLEKFDFSSLPNSFVLKPNMGLGGEGILVVYGKKKNLENVWVKADKSLITEDDLKNQIRNILDGSFSRTNIPDIAFFEERVRLSKTFKPYSYRGIPDIRVIIYNNVPVMAMLRLSTRDSQGKANLQLGGIGCGIDMATGTTTSSVQGKSKVIELVPESRLSLSGIKIPYWQEILELAIKAQQASGLGFLGADITIDRDDGPVFLELNARPGLSIQIANNEGLLARLERVEGLKVKSAKHGVKIAKNLFGGSIEEELEEISGKRVIGIREKVKIFYEKSKEVEVEAKIDTGAFSTSIDRELAQKIGFEKTIEEFEKIDLSKYELKPGKGKEIAEDILKKVKGKIPFLIKVSLVISSSGITMRPIVKIKFEMDGEKVFSMANITDRKDLKHQMIVGRKDLKKFLVEA
jgi:alpha-L-glutamate ligase-like protein